MTPLSDPQPVKRSEWEALTLAMVESHLPISGPEAVRVLAKRLKQRGWVFGAPADAMIPLPDGQQVPVTMAEQHPQPEQG